MSYLIPVLVMVGGLAFALWRWWSMSSKMGPAMHRFLGETEYRLEGAPDASIETSVRMWQANRQVQKRNRGYDVRLVRPYRGIWIRHRTSMGYEDDTYQKYFMAAWWRTELQDPRVVFHVAERSFSGVRAMVRDMFSNMEHDWQPAYPTAIKTGDPQVDRRFNVYGHDEVGVRAVLDDVRVRQTLLDLTEVDLLVASDGIQFSDPEQKNLRAGLGDYGGMVVSMDKLMTMSIDAHDRLCLLLHRVSELVSRA